jgi:CHASE2 domain-containing sensor protein
MAEARKPLERKTKIARAVTLLAVALAGFFFEDIKEWVPWLTELQVRSYNWVSKLGVRKPRPQWVMCLEIDDKTFYDYLKLAPGDATDRATLAQLVEKAADADPAVIALDIDLSWETPDSYEPRLSANRKLLEAITSAEKRKIPVVLTFGFEDPNSSNRQPQPNIFENNTLPDFGREKVPYRTRVGFDEAPADRRQIPLVIPGRRDKGEVMDYSSFSLEIVDAYESTLGILPRTKNILAHQIAKHQFVYTGFLLQQQFPRVSAMDVLSGNEDAVRAFRHRIVLIGGNRHKSKQGGDWVDNHRLPPLEMRGMYFQANRVEGLLDSRISTLVSPWTALILDLILGILLIHYSGIKAGLGRRAGTLAVLFIPVLLAYIASINLGYVLDFVLPLLLLFIHIFIEHYFDLRRSARI